MATLADYAVIIDGTATVVRGGTNFFRKTFSLPSNINPAVPAVFMYRVEVENADGLKYTMDLNGKDILTFVHSTNRFGTLHEVVDANIVHNGENKFQVVATAGEGTLKISDLVLFFQVNP
jgi:hypothetical protein